MGERRGDLPSKKSTEGVGTVGKPAFTKSLHTAICYSWARLFLLELHSPHPFSIVIIPCVQVSLPPQQPLCLP